MREGHVSKSSILRVLLSLGLAAALTPIGYGAGPVVAFLLTGNATESSSQLGAVGGALLGFILGIRTPMSKKGKRADRAT
jgi:hypothetical protein